MKTNESKYGGKSVIENKHRKASVCFITYNVYITEPQQIEQGCFKDKTLKFPTFFKLERKEFGIQVKSVELELLETLLKYNMYDNEIKQK